jgi:hypothetical protein
MANQTVTTTVNFDDASIGGSVLIYGTKACEVPFSADRVR